MSTSRFLFLACLALVSLPTAAPAQPDPVRISDGWAITTQDLQAFNQPWMTPSARDSVLQRACAWLRDRFDGMWETAERTIAMLRMYQATLDSRYLEELKIYTDAALRYRDDHHPVQKIDEFRGFVAAGWGGKGVNSAGYHAVVEVVSGLYGYSIAAFARIVADNPALQSRWG